MNFRTPRKVFEDLDDQIDTFLQEKENEEETKARERRKIQSSRREREKERRKQSSSSSSSDRKEEIRSKKDGKIIRDGKKKKV